MTTLSLWACQWHELRPISFGANLGTPSSNNAVVPSSEGDDEQDFDCESGRTKNTNPSYEMVNISSKSPDRAT